VRVWACSRAAGARAARYSAVAHAKSEISCEESGCEEGRPSGSGHLALHQWHSSSVAISGHQCQSVSIHVHPWHSVAPSGTQWHSVALACAVGIKTTSSLSCSWAARCTVRSTPSITPTSAPGRMLKRRAPRILRLTKRGAEHASDHQCPSALISAHQCSSERSSVLIGAHQYSSAPLTLDPGRLISAHQCSSVLISAHQRPSSVHISAPHFGSREASAS
jgi:hypothetical protein